MEITLLSESEITIYPRPGEAVVQRVITYQVEGLSPRTLWIDAARLPDRQWAKEHPGKLEIPVTVQVAGDKVRRTAIEADVKARQISTARKLP